MTATYLWPIALHFEMPKKSKAISREWATAIHEAGHAVIALDLGLCVEQVTLVPDEHRLGLCEVWLPHWLNRAARNPQAKRYAYDTARRTVIGHHVMHTLAGTEAESVLLGRPVTLWGAHGSYIDADHVWAYLRLLDVRGEKCMHGFVAGFTLLVRQRLERQWRTVRVVAKALIEAAKNNRGLSGPQLRRLYNATAR